MSDRTRFALAGVLVFGLVSCTSAQVGRQPIDSVNPLNDALQFGVGWVTGYDLNPQGNPLPSYGLNLVETFRQPDGRSAVLSDEPEVTIHGGISPNITTGTGGDGGKLNQLIKSLGGVAYGSGFGVPPLLDGALSGLNVVNQGVGGPPAFFPQPLDYTTITQSFLQGFRVVYPIPILDSGPTQLGVPLSLAQAQLPGAYVLNVTIPLQDSSPVLTRNVLLQHAPLGRVNAPAVAFDGSGGGVFTVSIPAGVTETYVNIATSSCLPLASGGGGSTPGPVSSPASGPTSAPGTSIPYYYTLLSHTPGPATLVLPLPDAIGPTVGGVAYHSICTASDLGGSFQASVQFYAVGFDYPAYEAVYPQSSSANPKITGNTGQPDLTVSPIVSVNAP